MERIMTDKAIIVFTYKSVETIIESGGTSSWTLDPVKARQCQYAICTRNAKSKRGRGGDEAHQSAFMIGKVKDVVVTPERQGRYIVLFSEYAEVTIPNIWRGDRNPVRYAPSLEALLKESGIKLSSLRWQRVKGSSVIANDEIEKKAGALTIPDAKKGLALTFGVSPDDVEIIIRG